MSDEVSGGEISDVVSCDKMYYAVSSDEITDAMLDIKTCPGMRCLMLCHVLGYLMHC